MDVICAQNLNFIFPFRMVNMGILILMPRQNLKFMQVMSFKQDTEFGIDVWLLKKKKTKPGSKRMAGLSK